MSSQIKRRHQTLAVKIGHIVMGGGAPIVVQSMTDTDTADVGKTADQCALLARAGSELVRITVNNEDSAQAVPEIRKRLDQLGYAHVPLVGDFHYNGHTLLRDYPECARALEKFRINPGNVGFGNKKDSQFNMMIDAAIEYDRPVRIGVNWGSLDKSLATQMMDDNAKSANPKSSQEILREASAVQDLIAVYNMLAERSNYALHLGLTEAGMGSKGIVASSIAMGVLLQQGIGDTIRTSLTPEPGASRDKEVIVSQQMLQTMGLRAFSPLVTSCPGCGRTTSTFFRELTQVVDEFIKERMPIWREKYSGVENMSLAVMGCIVNGPGESKHANIGISLPGSGEAPVAPVFIDGEKKYTLRGDDIAEQYKAIIEDYVQTQYVARDTALAE